MTRFRLMLSAAVLALALSACGDNPGTVISGTPAATGGDAENNATERDADPGSGTGDGTGSDATTTASEATTTANNDAVQLSISNKPDDIEYNQGVMSAPVGSPIVVEYNNPSQEPHNWVLVEPGQEQAVVDAAEAKGGNPEDIPGVIAWSETVTNNSTTVQVPPLEQSGGYTYLCTVPGHYEQGHRGAFDVK